MIPFKLEMGRFLCMGPVVSADEERDSAHGTPADGGAWNWVLQA